MLKKGEILDIDPSEIDFSNPEKAKEIFLKLLNAYANVMNEVSNLKEENQKLKDEINQLKGEKGKPDIKPNKDNEKNKDISSEKERKKRKKNKKRNRGPKLDKIKIDHEDTIEFSEEEKKNLPPDAKFSKYREKVVQNIKFETDNVLVKVEEYYSESEGKTYVPEIPNKYKCGEYGPGLLAFVIMLYYQLRVTKPLITSLLNHIGLQISSTKILEIIRSDKDGEITKEKFDILKVGSQTTKYNQTDDTGSRSEGINKYVNIFCNQFYTVFQTFNNKRRETLHKFLEEFKIVLFILIADDAPQFKLLGLLLQLCWVHEGRLFKKLNPVLSFQKKILDDFLTEFWAYYNELKNYKTNPTERMKKKLKRKFDELFSTVTEYEELNHRIALTKAKKENLLVVLDHPEVPIHNNASELGVRGWVMKRKISFGTRSQKGQIAWENYLSVLETCKKVDVNFWDYMKNKFEGIKQQSLAEVILERAAEATT